ncbi:hypothetical protein [Streptomyces sp. NPDC059928]|uniref:hypothetical protein n=1 Tax=unclassified Streptomyces TaxID=2593676 RepID=UPI003661BF97
MPDHLAGLRPGDDAPFGYGVSRHDRKGTVHILVADWTIAHHPGHPDSLWQEHRAGRWLSTAPARCGRVVTWKAASPVGDDHRPCPSCRLTDAQRALFEAHIGHPQPIITPRHSDDPM